ncbi:MAG: mannose-1-phosphate guanylyltransferase [Planctomycetota bacterium]
MLHTVIMAGGAGTRFWPASRRNHPKQVLQLAGDRSMLQSTVDRLEGLCPAERILVVTNQQLVEKVRQQLPQLPAAAVIGEPAKRDTAPCVALAAEWLLADDPEAVMLVTPADHVIEPAEKFREAIAQAVQLVEADPQRIVTFGIRPTYPAEVFGYIERGPALAGVGNCATFSVERFREKPDAATARKFLEAGTFYWNSGIFVWKAKTIAAAIREHEPAIAEQAARIVAARKRPDFPEVFQREFCAIKGKSIDYAVMEKYRPILVVEAPFHWDDVGNWTAVPRISGVDSAGNSPRGKTLSLDTCNTIIRTTDDHLLVTLGVSDLIIVHTPDATLIANRNDEAAVKQVVERLEQLGWDHYL